MLRRIKPWGIILAILFLLGVSGVAFGALGDHLLSKGARGPEVSELQKRLTQLGFVLGPVDGIFGSKTEAAVRRYQKERGLKVDGIAGPETIKDLKLLTGASTTAGGKAVGFKNSDVDLLARVISAEARGEPYRGQVAVGAVILNRIESSQFPNSIPDIVYQPRAFSSVDDGQIYMQASSSAVKAAYEALSGSDPSRGALYFFNPAKTSNKFIWSRPQITKIGNHIFAR